MVMTSAMFVAILLATQCNNIEVENNKYISYLQVVFLKHKIWMALAHDAHCLTV